MGAPVAAEAWFNSWQIQDRMRADAGEAEAEGGRACRMEWRQGGIGFVARAGKKVGGACWDAVLISNPAGGARSDVRLACEHNRDGPPGGFEVPTVF